MRAFVINSLYSWFSFCAAAQVALAQPPATGLPSEVRAALESHSAFLTPLTIEWELRRESRRSLPNLLTIIGFPVPANQNFLQPVRVIERYHEDKVFLQRNETSVQARVSPDQSRSQPPTDIRLIRSTQEFSYNGSKLYSGSPDRGKTLLIHYLPHAVEKYGHARFLAAEFFSKVGLATPNNVADIEAGLTSPRARVIYFLEQGGQLQTSESVDLDGVRCLRVAIRLSDQLHTFFLDPSIGYAVRRYELARFEGPDARISQITTADGFRELDEASGFSLPMQCRVEYFQFARSGFVPQATPLFTEQYSVKRLEREPIDDNEFVLVYTTPGTSIADGTLPGADRAPEGEITYIVPADPAELDRIVDLAIEKSVPPRRFWLPLIVVTLTGGLLVFGIWFLYRWKTS